MRSTVVIDVKVWTLNSIVQSFECLYHWLIQNLISQVSYLSIDNCRSIFSPCLAGLLKAYICTACNTVLVSYSPHVKDILAYSLRQAWSDEKEYNRRYGKWSIEQIWRDDILPCRAYLRHWYVDVLPFPGCSMFTYFSECQQNMFQRYSFDPTIKLKSNGSHCTSTGLISVLSRNFVTVQTPVAFWKHKTRFFRMFWLQCTCS